MPAAVPRALLVALVVLAGFLSAPAPAAATPPFIRGVETVPVYDYADAIRESVWVQT